MYLHIMVTSVLPLIPDSLEDGEIFPILPTRKMRL